MGLVDPTHTSLSSKQSYDTPKQAARVLIVEDDLTYEPIWNHILSQVDHNARTEWATSVDEAERKIRQSIFENHKFDLVISDIFLSGSQTGIDLWNTYQDILCNKLILVSSVDNVNIKKYFKESQGAPFYLQKPLMVNECLETLSGILQSK